MCTFLLCFLIFSFLSLTDYFQAKQNLVSITKELSQLQQNKSISPQIDSHPETMWQTIYNCASDASLELIILKNKINDQKIEFALQAQGSYSHILNFLNKISNPNLLVTFTKLKIVKNKKYNISTLNLTLTSSGKIIPSNFDPHNNSALQPRRYAGYIMVGEHKKFLYITDGPVITRLAMRGLLSG